MATDEAVLSLLHHGADLHNAGRLDEAVEIYDRVLQVAPHNPDALHLKGILLHAKAKQLPEKRSGAGGVGMEEEDGANSATTQLHETAVELVRAALELAPSRFDILTNLGEVLRAAGRLEEATEVLRRATSLEPSHAQAWFNLAVLLEHRSALLGPQEGPGLALGRQAEEALHEFLRCVTDGKAAAEGRSLLGDILRRRQAFDEALQLFSNAVVRRICHWGRFRRASRVQSFKHNQEKGSLMR